MVELDRKLFLGGRLKRLRRELDLTQTRMAGDLGVSPSYLNLLERNQRPLTAGVLLRLARTYDLDLRSFTGDPEAGGEAELQEVFADPLFKGLAIPRHEVSSLVENAPGAAEAVVRLYRALLDQRRRAPPGGLSELAGGGDGFSIEWVRDYIQTHRNHFAELDTAAETLSGELGHGPNFEAAAAERLLERSGIAVRVMPIRIMKGWLRRYDYHLKRLMLSETLAPSSRAFAVGYQIAVSEVGDAVDRRTELAAPPDQATRQLLRVSLLNYVAGALMMPYGPFLSAAEDLSYDLGLLRARFGASFEQVCHRLTTLARPGASGVPFFLLRIDQAGNVSKRFASLSFPFSRLGGACPRWNIHSVFKTPGRILTQVIETPDGGRFLTMACAVSRSAVAWEGGDEAELAVGLGCELKFAARLVYARGLDLDRPAVTEVGPTCRLCERVNCRERAAPPVTRSLVVEPWSKTVTAFPFSPH